MMLKLLNVMNNNMSCQLILFQQQEPFKFPDMAFCVSFMRGCLTSGSSCFNSHKETWWPTGFYVSYM